MAEEGDFLIDGQVYDPNTLTFREQREMRRIVHDELYQGEKVSDDDLSLADTLPALAVVLVRRSNASYTLDEALDLVPGDVMLTAEKAKELNRPPTKGAAKPAGKKTPAVSGSPT